MKILNASKADLADALEGLSQKLRSGMVSTESSEKTVAVFGEPLSPIECVRRIIGDVRERGDDAVAEYTRKLDGAELSPEDFRVSRDEMSDAYDDVPDAFKEALAQAKDNIWRFQEHIRLRTPPPFRDRYGGLLSAQYMPLQRVGVYVPGGAAAYPSTVLMAAVPAQVAHVHEIAVVTPCGPDGKVRAETLAAAYEAGISEVYRVGGAQAIAALAIGTPAIRRVDKIVGPGNIFVTLAKREVYGEVDLDMLAGPSEVLVIADENANPRFLAADLLSQAEHNPAASVLLATSEEIAKRTLEEVEKQLETLSRGPAARECFERYGFIAVTRDLDQAVELANQFAPEHLEVAVDNPKAILPKLHSAGAIFVGQFTPEPVGDYVAGPSHVLPTGGTARFFSGLSVNDFLRRSSVLIYSEEALRAAAPQVDILARAEGLDAHARAATIRTERDANAQEPGE